MSTSVEQREVSAPRSWRPIDEAVWQAWIAKARAQDRRGRAARLRAVKWVSIAALLAAAAPWSNHIMYGVVVRFVVTAGAIAVMLQEIHSRRYAFAALFGAIALLFNPVVPAFAFRDDWQRALAVACAAPFVVSLALLKDDTK